jgi:hypothetical protein
MTSPSSGCVPQVELNPILVGHRAEGGAVIRGRLAIMQTAQRASQAFSAHFRGQDFGPVGAFGDLRNADAAGHALAKLALGTFQPLRDFDVHQTLVV